MEEKTIYRFADSTAMIPPEVRDAAVGDLTDFQGEGILPAETDRHSPAYLSHAENCCNLLREILNIPSHYRIFWMPGGARTQFAAVPLNLLSEHRMADYLVTGRYARLAYLEAKKYGDIAIAASTGGAIPPYSSLPSVGKSDFRPDTDYVYLRVNDPVYGTRFSAFPNTGSLPVAADFSGCFLNEPIDVSRFGVIFADVQDCLAAPNTTVVIVREDFVGHAREGTPSCLDYRAVEEEASAYLPSLQSLCCAERMLTYIRQIGGTEELKRRCERKAGKLYDYLDSQHYYTVPVDSKYRSAMSVVFCTGSAALDDTFLQEAQSAGLYGLAGHPSVGGLRACLNLFLPSEGVEALVDFMRSFALRHPRLDIE